MASEFLAELERAAAKRAVAANFRRGKPCLVCKGTGSVTRYVLPNVTGPDACKSCDGKGKVR